MSTLEALTGRGWLSHSSLTTWLGCGEKYFLEKVAQVPQDKAWYLIGGSAFHTATEFLDREELTDPDEAWKHAWINHYDENVTDAGVDPADVRAGGRATKEWPNKENADWWAVNGLAMTRQYLAWRQQAFAAGWQWFILPDGSPAVEVPIQIDLDGVLVKGYIDRVMVNPVGELTVVDLKTGSHTPASTLQLGIYALGVHRHFDVTPTVGSYYMARKGELTEPRSLLHYTPALVGSWFKHAKNGIEQGIFIPNVTAMCASCTVKQHCTAFGAPYRSFESIATSHGKEDMHVSA